MPQPAPDDGAGFAPEALAAAGFEPLTYEVLEVGAEFTSDDRLLRPQDVEAFAFAVDDHDPWFFGAGPFDRPIVHPTLCGNQALFLRHTRYVVPAGLHARMVFRFLRPIELGLRLRTRGRVVDKYERRDKPYMVTEFVTADEAGRELVAGSFTQMLFRAERAPTAGGRPRAGRNAPAGRADDDDSAATVPERPGPSHVEGRAGRLTVGQPLGPLVKHLDQRRIDAYSGVRPGSIHTDPAWARAKGFRTTLAQGMMSTAYVSELMTRAVGAGFVAGRRDGCPLHPTGLRRRHAHGLRPGPPVDPRAGWGRRGGGGRRALRERSRRGDHGGHGQRARRFLRAGSTAVVYRDVAIVESRVRLRRMIVA